MNNRRVFSCPNCAGAIAQTKISGSDTRSPMVQCIDCGAEMFWPIPSEAELVAYYARGNWLTDEGRAKAVAYLENPKETRLVSENYVKQLQNFGVPDGGVFVDLGCSFGQGTIELRRLGFDAWGVELSEEAMAWLNLNGGKGYCGTILDSKFPISSADCVFTSHTLEHMANPFAAIRKIHDLLRPNGVLQITLPHWGGMIAQRQTTNWKWFGYPVHIHYFRADTLPTIMRGLGFEVLVTSTSCAKHEIEEILDVFGIDDDGERRASHRALEKIVHAGLFGEQLNLVCRRIG